MRWVNLVGARLRALLRREAVIRDIDEELRLHIEMETEANIEKGMAPGEARAAAQRSFGNLGRVKDVAYQVRGGGMIETLLQDMRYGGRVLARRPGFTAVTLFILALGIGANTAIFSVVNAVLLRPLPIRDSGRVAVISNQMPKLSLPRTQVSALQYLDYRRQTEAFDSTAVLTWQNFNLTGTRDPLRLQAGRVTASFFPMLGVTPLMGRVFTDEEDKYGGPHVALLSFGLWKRLFNQDPGAVGKAIELNQVSYQIIGAMPAELEQLYPRADFWIPMAFSPSDLSENRRWSLAFTMLARLKPGVGFPQAQAAMTQVAGNMTGGVGDSFSIEVRPILEQKVASVRRPLYLLLCAVAVVLLISCANIASLLLARATARAREIAIRAALGAGKRRIVRQLVTESMLIAVAGGALGVLVARWGTRALIALAPADLPRIGEVRLDAAVLWFTLAISVASGILFGLVPAIAASKTDIASSLKESGRTDAASSPRHRLRGGLVIAEVALAFVVLISAGLLLRSFRRLLDVRPGFDPHNVLTMQVSLPRNLYTDWPRVNGFDVAVLQRVAGLPGVMHAAFADQPPFTPGGDNSVFAIRGRQVAAGDPPPHADYLYVTPDYFRAMGIPLLAGREVQPSDARAQSSTGPGTIAIVDEALAKRLWPDGDALGADIGWSDKGPWATVVGIVATVHADDLTEESKGTFYLLGYPNASTLVVRASGDPHALIQPIRDQVLAVDRNQPVYDIQTMDERLARSLDQRRFAVMLLGVFAGLALLLAAIGLYGVIAYLVTQRTHEIGVRVALGAQTRDVLRLIVGQGLRLAVAGVVIGLAGAYLLTHLMTSLLYGVTATDPLTFIGVSGILLAAALLGCYLPARRGANVDPMIALRNE